MDILNDFILMEKVVIANTHSIISILKIRPTGSRLITSY